MTTERHLVPDLVGITVAQARVEWQQRRRRYIRSSDRQQHQPDSLTFVWHGFTGSITPASGSDEAIVTAFATTPHYGSFPTSGQQAAGTEWPRLPSTASVVLTYAYAPGTYSLVTGDGDPLVTAAGDPLIVEIT